MSDFQPRVLFESPAGDIVEMQGIVYLLTPCCKASSKGTSNGVACRKCYQPLDDVWGWGALASKTNESEMTTILTMAKFPEPTLTAIKAVARLRLYQRWEREDTGA